MDSLGARGAFATMPRMDSEHITLKLESSAQNSSPEGGGGRGPSPDADSLAGGIVAAFALAVIAILLISFACSSSSAQDDADTAERDWSNLQAEGDRLYYYEDGRLLSQLGVDVSDHQGDIDWEAVAADGIDFAMVRLGNRGYSEGTVYVDDCAAENLDGAAAAGLEVGAYFFSQATTEEEAIEEAQLALEVLDGRGLDLPVVFDHEPMSDEGGRAAEVEGEQLAACAVAFCEVLEEAGYETMIYGNAEDIERFGDADLGGRPIWLAEYDVDAPSADFDFAMWQYTASGGVEGIEGEVDLNLLFTDSL